MFKTKKLAWFSLNESQSEVEQSRCNPRVLFDINEQNGPADYGFKETKNQGISSLKEPRNDTQSCRYLIGN